MTKQPKVRKPHPILHGIGVNVWTVNKKELMKQLNNWNVDGIFTNFPDRAKELGLEK